MNEKNSINNSRTTESAPGAVPEEPISPDKLSRLLKDAMASPDGGDFFKCLLRDEFDNTPETIIGFLRLAQKHSKENSKLDIYSLIRLRVHIDVARDLQKDVLFDTSVPQGLKDNLVDYMQSFLEYGRKLEDRQKVISDLSQSIDLIDDPVVKEAVNQKYEKLLDVHEEFAYLRYSMGELRCKVEKEKWKHSYASFSEHDPLFDEINENMNSLLKSVSNQEKKLDQWEGEYPEGLRALGEVAYKDVPEKISDTLVRLNKAGIKGVDEDIFYARFIFNHSLDKIVADLAKKRNWKRDRSTISRHIADIKLKLKKANINPNVIEKIRESKQH